MNKSLKYALAAVVAVGTAFGTASAAEFDGELVIGDFQPLSGSAAAGGINNHNALKLAVKQYNEGSHPLNPTPGLKVGDKTYKLTTAVYDHKYTAEGGVTSANKLVFDDGAKFVTGTWGSTPSISAAETVFEPNKILFASTGWSNKVIGPDKPFTFRLHMTGREYNGAVYAYLKEARPELKKVATLCASDDAGHSAGKAIREQAESHGFEIVAEEFQERGTTDFYSFLTRIMAKDPDILDVCGAVPGDESLMIKQFRELGGDALISAAGSVPSVLFDVAGKEAVEGVLITQGVNYYTPGNVISDAQRKYAADFKAEFNEEAPYSSEKAYDMAIGIFEAIKKAGTLDTTKVRDTLRELSWQLTTGDMSSWGGEELYGIKHQIITPTFISEIRNGEVVTVAKVITPVP